MVRRGHEPIRVLLIDESAIAIQGLKALLSTRTQIVVVGTAGNQTQAREVLETCRPNVVVLDVLIGRASGINLCRTIRKSHPHVAVLFFTATDDATILRAAIAAGAQGYLLRTASCDALATSIEILAVGRAMIDRQLTPQILAWIREGSRLGPDPFRTDFTTEDLTVLYRVVAGKTTNEIAQELNLERRMVRARLRRIYKRLHVSRRAEAVSCFVKYQRERLHGLTRSGWPDSPRSFCDG